MNPNPHILEIDNRQEDRPVDLRRLRAWTLAALESMGCTAELGIHLVGAQEMAQVNWDYLRHQGSTDVITFDHGSNPDHLHGELYISVADAILQADEFGTTWPEELGRYVIHGLLHLHGEDDLDPAARRRMKKRENQLVRQVGDVVPSDSIERPPGSRSPSSNG